MSFETSRDQPAREAFLSPEMGGTIIKKTFPFPSTNSNVCVWTKKGIFVVPKHLMKNL